MHRLALTLALLLVCLSAPALASNGVVEINQTCAVQTGCFPGDTPGFPVLVTQSGSYRLTSNLTMPDENTTGIQIESPAVDLDLSGFAIEGPTVCSDAGQPPQITCSPVGSGSGVFSSEGNLGIRVRNGVARGLGFIGIATPANSVVENVRVFDNGSYGIFASVGARISDCHASRNGLGGVRVLEGSKIIDCTAELNGGNGFEALGEGVQLKRLQARRNRIDGIHVGERGGSVSDSVSQQNGDDGIDASLAAIITDNLVLKNGAEGITGGEGSTITGNTSYENGSFGILAVRGSTISGNTSSFNDSDGIRTSGSGCTVDGNTVTLNGGFGLSLSIGGSYRANVVRGNSGGTVDGALVVDLGGNFCEGSTTCP